MINFFRKIRKRLADDNKPLKYLRYALGEILLVVFGILIALQINNWNEDRKAQNKTNAYLVMLSDEIKTNLGRLDLSQKFAEDHSAFRRNTLKELNSDSAGALDIDTFNTLILSQGPFVKWELVRSSFDDLINSGAMENMRDSLLRNQIFSMEASFKRYENADKDVRIVWEQHIRPYNSEHSNVSWLHAWGDESMKFNFKTDFEAFIHNRTYANMLSEIIIFIHNYVRAIEGIRKEFSATLENIASYLGEEAQEH